jgi:hypothetical protein
MQFAKRIRRADLSNRHFLKNEQFQLFRLSKTAATPQSFSLPRPEERIAKGFGMIFNQELFSLYFVYMAGFLWYNN